MSTEDRSAYPHESQHAPGRAEDELDEASRRLEDVNWEPFPPEARPGGPEYPAEDSDPFTAFAEAQLRERPIVTLAAAAAAGWIVGKILR